MLNYNKLIFEVSREGRRAIQLPKCDVDEVSLSSMISSEFLKETEVDLPEVSEVDVIRHFTNISNKNYGVDTGFYPLGSCTMK